MPTPRDTKPDFGRALCGGLVLALALSGASPAAAAGNAQIVLERDAGAVRLWSSSGRPVDVPLPPSHQPRVAIEAEGGHIVAGVDQARGDIFFRHHAQGATRELPLPASRGDGARIWPVLLTSADRLDGALWLEGSDSQDFALHAAAWNGTSWEGVEVVSPSRGRPQLAPSATVLSDGSWLVVWAGYDGNDDEIYWSLRRDGAWSTRRRLDRDNRVPDILPSVVAHGDGAHAAWSFFDGNDYRVKTAAWDGAAWHIESVLTGLGAVDAGWHRIDDRAFVTYHSVEPRGWTLIEVDADGIVVHESRSTGDAADRPLVTATGVSRPRLSFPVRDRR